MGDGHPFARIIVKIDSRRNVMVNWLPETTNLLTTVIMMDARQYAMIGSAAGGISSDSFQMLESVCDAGGLSPGEAAAPLSTLFASSALSCCRNNDSRTSYSARRRAFSSRSNGDPGSAASATLTNDPRGERPSVRCELGVVGSDMAVAGILWVVGRCQ